MFSQRNLQGLVSRCPDYEFEDVVCSIDKVDLLLPQPRKLFSLGHKIVNRLAKHAYIHCLSPGVKKIRFKKSYDLFMVKCLFLSDLLSLNALAGWKQACGTSVCWLGESWAGELHKYKGHLKILAQFDYVIINCSASIHPIQDIIQRPCLYIPFGVDTIRFSPYPDPPVRCIDVYNLGRRSLVTHQKLLKMAEQKKIFYIYDTINRLETSNPRQHRTLIADFAKRSRYFFANAGKIDQPSETHKQGEIGPRFFEGAAAGAVMLGDYPENEAFKNNFDWPDAVIKVSFRSPDIDEILADLDSQPERLEEIRRNSVVQSLLRHDWVYRWRTILDMVGLEPKPALIDRENHLKKLAAEVAKTAPS
jgi:glycosyltransferase involved in cell wall biosynthesis